MRAYVEWQNALVDHDAMARDRFVESPLVHPSVAMRTAALRRLGGWRDFDGPEDYDLWLRALRRGAALRQARGDAPRVARLAGPADPHGPALRARRASSR